MVRKIINKCSDCGKVLLPTKMAFGRCSTHYQLHRRRTDLEFFLNERYTSMVKRTNYKADLRHYGLSVCSREEFMKFCENNSQLTQLWNDWKHHNYDLGNCPSIDRVNNKLGYDLGNIQWITQSENAAKDKRVSVKAYKDGKLVGEYSSKKSAGEALGVHPANIYKVYAGLRHSTGGYTFEKLDHE